MTAQIRRRGRHARRYTTLRMMGGAVLLAVLVAAVFVTGAIAQPLPSQAASRPPVHLYIGTYPRCLYGVAHGSQGPQCSVPDPTANLTRELLTVFYERGEPRSLLLHYYRWQQPGWQASMYGSYVRSLIIEYPRAMRSCLIALHNRRPYASLGRICP